MYTLFNLWIKQDFQSQNLDPQRLKQTKWLNVKQMHSQKGRMVERYHRCNALEIQAVLEHANLNAAEDF